ncbi:DUF5958 family protein [Limnoglobus roseus]|uniref:Uncharacterized protein n=1 Tax=Limnoglobus roseus TaxID=2598579 RepID=A0A5C1A4T8_9BACT|nr:DUF5958 family protein [Limnoglobus roseus]QEL13417.1 hypothetical protein PX52LOC_00272 [Limnoglobus roseus]
MDDFDLADLIRMNQLVRGRIDYKGFCTWYEALPPEQRRGLTGLLLEFAHQAGVTEQLWNEALMASGLTESDGVVQRLWIARKADNTGLALHKFIWALPATELPTLFRVAVYLFGIAEGNVFRNEVKEHCNHWWHRDLMDKRVVQDLLNDSQYYSTAMRNDDRIRNRG